MHSFLCALVALQIGWFPSAGLAPERTSLRMTVTQDVYEHGGGCRKSSPPGQCCHMDRRTGIVHCH